MKPTKHLDLFPSIRMLCFPIRVYGIMLNGTWEKITFFSKSFLSNIRLELLLLYCLLLLLLVLSVYWEFGNVEMSHIFFIF
jgi:hypothetical protein